MTVNLSLLGGAGAQFFDNNGVILSGGLVYTYAAGTTTPQAAYTTSSGSTAHTNPIVLDSAGRVASGGEIWLTDAVAYKFVLKTSTAVTIGTYDNVTGNASGIYAAFAASSGSSLVGYLPAGTGAVATTVQTKLRESVSVKDFGAVGNGIADDTAAINAAHTYSVANNFPDIIFPSGTYLVSSGFNWSPFVCPKSTGNVVINFSPASGTLFAINSDYGQPAITVATGGALDSERILFDSNFIFQATNATNTCKVFVLGTSTSALATRFINIVGVSTSNFASCVEYLSHTYLCTFTNCNFLGNYDLTRKANCHGISQTPITITDSGENFVFNNCTFQHVNNAVWNNNLYGSNGLGIKFNDCSFDQCLQVVGDDISVDKYEFTNCHFEGAGTTTPFYVSGNTAQTSGDMILISAGLWYMPSGITPANPALAVVKNYGRLVIRNLIHSLGSATVNVVSVAANSYLNREDEPRYAMLSYIPTTYSTTVTQVNLQAAATCQTITYTPTWTSDGGGQILGSSTITGEYYRVGRQIFVRIKLAIVTGGTYNPGSGVWNFGLPSGLLQDASGLNSLGVCFINDSGTGEYVGICRLNGISDTTINCYTTAAFPAIVGATFPVTWATGDYIEMSCTYVTLPN